MNTTNILGKPATKHPAALTYPRSQTHSHRILLPLMVLAAWLIANADFVCADTIFPASPPESGHSRNYYTLKAWHSDLFVQIPEASTVNGIQAIQWNGGIKNMHNEWEELSTDNYTYIIFRNRWSRQCLDVLSKEPGDPVVQRPCNGKASQKWKKILYAAGYDENGPWNGYYIRNKWSGLDLNVEGAAVAFGAKLIQWFPSDGVTNSIFEVFGRSVEEK